MIALYPVFIAALPLVVIDPGHGGEQEGAVGVCGVLEKDVALSVSQELERILNATGKVRTLLTRNEDVDVPLEDRAALANQEGAALFVSIHANASSSPKHAGVETFFLSLKSATDRHKKLVHRENEGRVFRHDNSKGLERLLKNVAMDAAHRESQRLALLLHDELARETPFRARGVMQAPFLVLRGAQMAAVLVELGFLTHREQCRRLADRKHRELIATRLAGGILAHLAITGRGTDDKRVSRAP